MTLRDFKSLLAAHSAHGLQLLLPEGGAVPESFHITEVGHVQKTFLDCGGTLHQTHTCQLQVWLGADDHHRLATQKFSAILSRAATILPDENVEVEFEYEASLISQYPISRAEVTDAALIFHLRNRHTDCLAKEVCIAPSGGAAASCCGSGECGTPDLLSVKPEPKLSLIPS